MEDRRVHITVDEKHRDHMSEVVTHLEEHGFVVERVMVSLGMVTGTTANTAVLGEVEGVQRVMPDRVVTIAPPEAEIQ